MGWKNIMLDSFYANDLLNCQDKLLLSQSNLRLKFIQLLPKQTYANTNRMINKLL